MRTAFNIRNRTTSGDISPLYHVMLGWEPLITVAKVGLYLLKEQIRASSLEANAYDEVD